MSSPLTLFPQRIAIGRVNVGGRDMPVHISPEFFRALQELLRRVGGSSSEVPDLNQFFLEATMGAPMGQDDIAAGAMMFGQVVMQDGGPAGEEGAALVLGVPMPPAPVGEAVLACAAVDQSALPFRALEVEPSPMAFRADRRCAVHIEGATDSLTLARAGMDLDVSGAQIIELNLGDALTVEYTDAPVLTLIPR